MASLQFQFFDDTDANPALQLLEGFSYRPGLIEADEEAALVARVRELPFREFDFHGFKGKRRTVSFGWKYDFSGQALQKADDLPDFLLSLRARAASFAGVEPAALEHVLVTEYSPGAGIGWHRDKNVFGQVVGISLLSPCVLRFRRKKTDTSASSDLTPERKLRSVRPASQPIDVGSTSRPTGRVSSSRQWERVNVSAAPRSAYHLTGAARLQWQHSILRVDGLRYSITFRTLHEERY
jgi:alkylated DNA repair dioxygenase AlkB